VELIGPDARATIWPGMESCAVNHARLFACVFNPEPVVAGPATLPLQKLNVDRAAGYVLQD